MSKKGYSRKGIFGETIHYDSKGRKVGESRPNAFGGAVHYNAKGKKIGETRKSFWGGVEHRDKRGRKVTGGSAGFFGNYESHSSKRGSYDEYEAIEAEMMDEALDSREATEWLIDNGYDPDDFDI